MGNCLKAFAKNETDLNNNGIKDRDEIINVINEYVLKKLEEIEKKELEKSVKLKTKNIKRLIR